MSTARGVGEPREAVEDKRILGGGYLRSLSRRWVTIYIPLGIILFILFFPFYWMVITSFKKHPTKNVGNPFLINEPTLQHYKDLIFNTPFPQWMLNTLIIAIAATVISLFASTLAAYAVERLRFRGAKQLGASVFFAYLVPPALLFIPLATVAFQYGLFNTRWILILVYPTFLVPFCTWLLMGFFRSIPYEIEECALVDGANRWQIMTKLILPLAVPGLISAGIFAFTLCWNEYLYALTLISSTSQKTVAVGVVTGIIEGDVYHWGELMAGAVLGSVPVAILYSFFVDYYVSGMTGAVKE